MRTRARRFARDARLQGANGGTRCCGERRDVPHQSCSAKDSHFATHSRCRSGCSAPEGDKRSELVGVATDGES